MWPGTWDMCRWFADTPEAYGAFTKRQWVTKLQCFSGRKKPSCQRFLNHIGRKHVCLPDRRKFVKHENSFISQTNTRQIHDSQRYTETMQLDSTVFWGSIHWWKSCICRSCWCNAPELWQNPQKRLYPLRMLVSAARWRRKLKANVAQPSDLTHLKRMQSGRLSNNTTTSPSSALCFRQLSQLKLRHYWHRPGFWALLSSHPVNSGRFTCCILL